MLDLERRLRLPDFPDLSVYGDHERPLTYYVVPSAPTLELDDGGRPDARLLLYLKRQGDQKLPSGGQISLTTVLLTPPTDLARIKNAIERMLIAQQPPATVPPRVTVQLTGPDWASGTVTIVLTPSLTLSGQPSLFSDNRCALMNALTAEQALTLREQWGRKLPDAYIAYDMVMRVASTTSAIGGVSETFSVQSAGGTIDRTNTVGVTAHATAAGTHSIALRGRLWMDGLERRLTEIDLG